MSYKKFYPKALLFTLVLFTILPGILTPIIAENNQNNDLSINTAYDKVHKGFVVLSETLSNLLDIDTHIIELKADKEYYFSVKFDNPNGPFLSLFVSNGVDSGFRNGDWDANTPKNQWKVELVITPTSTDNFTIMISETNGFDLIETNYTLYANRSGFAGIWWMILSGIGVLVVIILVILLLFKMFKKKPKKKKRKK